MSAGWLTPAEAAHRLGVHVRTVYDGCAAGQVPHRRVGRSLRVPAWWVDGRDLDPGRGEGPTGEPGRSLDLITCDDDEVTADGTGAM